MTNIISTEKPECWDRLEKEFGVNWDSGIIVTYNGIIHTKTGMISPDFFAHELVHVKQQEGTDPVEYLESYIKDKEFRKEKEAAAFKIQALFIDLTFTYPEERIEHKKKLLKGMLLNYKDCFTEEEAKEILGL